MSDDPNELYGVPPEQQLDEDEPHTPGSGSHAGYPDHIDDVEFGAVDFIGDD